MQILGGFVPKSKLNINGGLQVWVWLWLLNLTQLHKNIPFLSLGFLLSVEE